MSEEWGALGLAGPKSRDILDKVTECDLSSEHFPHLHAEWINIAGMMVGAIRTSFTGKCYFIIFDILVFNYLININYINFNFFFIQGSLVGSYM